jgi:uncharacterized SAM-binding protein YcdF (DUF218 family)
MEEAFFIASKTLGLIARVETWIVIGLVLALLAAWRGRRGWSMGWMAATLALVLGLTVYPLGNPLVLALESQYPADPPLGQIDGIIVLGGSEDLGPYLRWGGLEVNEAGERLIAGVELARRFPDAKLIYTGGTAGLFANPDPGLPSRMVDAFWLKEGIPERQITLEDKSRTTAENAQFTKAMIQPQPGQHYVLVTSAWHMPRAMEAFSRAGWQNLTAWPVDFRSERRTLKAEWRLDDHLVQIDLALKEYLGRAAYYLAGKA